MKFQSKMYRWRHCLRLLAVAGMLVGGTARAADKFGSPSFFWIATANFHSVNAAVLNPVSLEMQMGFPISRFIYFGIAGDYFLGKRSSAGTTTTLNLMSGGGELGIIRAQPRFFWLLTAGVFYPLTANLTTSAGASFANTNVLLSYRARLLVGIRMSPSIALTLGGGYRWLNLGDLTGFSANPVDLTGFIISGGFSLTL